MRLDLDVAQHQLTWDEIRSRARLAEAAGFDGVWVFDHFTPLYGDRGGPCFEGWTVLAALAAATERVRLGVLVTGVTYRHPSVLTAEAVTVDHISGGRLDFGIGAAWFEQEHHELGIDFPRRAGRARRLREAVEVAKLLMTTDDASYDGRHYRLRNATYNPKPKQEPHPPIWIGARGEQLMLPIVAEHADVWHSYGNLEMLARKSKLIDRFAADAGRDPASIARASGLSISEPWDEVRTRAAELRRLGFSSVTVGWPSEGQGRLEEFVADVMPDLRG